MQRDRVQPSFLAYTTPERILLGQQAKNDPDKAIRQLSLMLPQRKTQSIRPRRYSRRYKSSSILYKKEQIQYIDKTKATSRQCPTLALTLKAP